MNTKSKLKAISIGIAAIMMVSLLAAVTTVSASPGVDVTDCWIGDDNKVYFTIYSAAKADGYMCLNINGVYEERKKYTLNAGETATLSFRLYRWNEVDDVEVCVDCIDTSCCTPPGPTPPTPPPPPPLPDLIVEKTVEFVEGGFVVHYKVTNNGDGSADASKICKSVDDVCTEVKDVPALGPDGFSCGDFDLETCQPGELFTVTVCADCTEVVDESNENNNCEINAVTCLTPPPEKPDLIVIEKREEPVDGQVIVHFVVKNRGDADAGASYATLYIDRVRAKEQNVPVPVLGPNGTFISEFAPEPCSPGETITITVCADDTNVVDESNEDNNCNQNQYTCLESEKPDLVVSEMSEEPVRANGHVIVHFVVKNIGTANAGESYATKYLYIDDVLKERHDVPVPELGPGGTFSSAFEPEECPRDENITVTVCADDTNVVDESNETNNCMTDNFTCPAQGPDLVINKTVEMINPYWHCDECKYNVHYKVTNIGNETASWCCGDNAVALLVDGMLEEVHEYIADLGPGASYEDTFWWKDCPCGEPFDVTVCADYYNVIDESDETNNCETNPEYCGVGDIEVDKKVWNRATGEWVNTIYNREYGDIVEFRGIVENTGCCCELTDITVTDVLSRSLEFVSATGNPSVDYNPTDKTTTLTWTKSLLDQCEDEYYYIRARVIGCGEDNRWDKNTMTASATTCTGEVVEDSDIAEVDAPPKARMTVTKKVRDPATGNWVDRINVWSGTHVTFKLAVRNDGTCHDLYNIQVWDELSRSLRYTSSSGPQLPWGPQPAVVTGPDVNGVTTVDWNLVTMEPVAPGEELVFYVYATARGNFVLDINHLQATAYSLERGTTYGMPLYGEDWAYVWSW